MLCSFNWFKYVALFSGFELLLSSSFFVLSVSQAVLSFSSILWSWSVWAVSDAPENEWEQKSVLIIKLSNWSLNLLTWIDDIQHEQKMCLLFILFSLSLWNANCSITPRSSTSQWLKSDSVKYNSKSVSDGREGYEIHVFWWWTMRKLAQFGRNSSEYKRNPYQRLCRWFVRYHSQNVCQHQNEFRCYCLHAT